MQRAPRYIFVALEILLLRQFCPKDKVENASERSRIANPTSTATTSTAVADDTAGTDAEPAYANTPRTSSSTTTAAKPDVAGFVTKNDSKVSSEGTFET